MTEQEIFNVPIPSYGTYYKPVSHREIIEITETYLSSNGLSVVDKRYNIGKNGEQLIAYWRLGNTGIHNPEMGPMIAFRNSYDKSMSFGYCAGSQVFICSNGMVRGDIGAIRQKHIGSIRIDLEDNIYKIILNLASVHDRNTWLSESLKEINLSQRQTAELLGRMYIEKEIISPTELNIIKRELKEPTYEDFKASTAWNLYNHCTFSLKETHPLNSLKKHSEVTKFFEEEVLI